MTKQKRIEGLLMQLSHGYDAKLVDEINSLRIDIKAEKNRGKKLKVYCDDIQPIGVRINNN